MHPYDDWGSDYAVGDTYTYSNYRTEDTRSLNVTLGHTTEKAYLFGVVVNNVYEKFWIPKKYVSIIHTDGTQRVIKIPTWIQLKRAK